MNGDPPSRARRAPAAGPRGFVVDGHAFPAAPAAPGLHVVATPIGNLRDIGLRALETLAGADVILAEDTRVSGVLLERYGIKARPRAFHEHNEEAETARVLAELAEGLSVALISDAGTPLVSDPGWRLVAAARAAGHPVTTVPGPSALTAALAISGLPTDRFFFEGFLPPRAAARRARLAELAGIPGTLVFFESPRRVAEMLADAAATLGGAREAAVARELTKHFEEVRRGRLDALAAEYAAGPEPRGEIVVLIGRAVADETAEASADEAIDADLAAEMARVSLKEAVARVAAATGKPRRVVYARALALSRR